MSPQPPWIDQVRFGPDGLIPAIAQDATSGTILMMAWMNAQALHETWRTGQAVYWTRSRQKLWRKGEESGHTQRVLEIRLDCDADAIVLKVEQAGGIACHTGRTSCFYQRLQDDGHGRAHWVAADPVIKDPKDIYS